LWASFAEREPNISSQLGVAERSALSEASAGTKNREIFKINSRAERSALSEASAETLWRKFLHKENRRAGAVGAKLRA